MQSLRKAPVVFSIAVALAAVTACATGVIDPETAAYLPAFRDASTLDGANGEGTPGLSRNDAGRPEDAAGNRPDATDAGAKDSAPSALAPCASLFINEVQVAGASASDEYVEIYNASAVACNAAGWKLVYRAATGTSDGILFQGLASVPGHGFVVVGGTGFSGPKDGTLAGGLAAAGGQLQLRDSADVARDSLGYGTAAGAFVQGVAADAPAAGHSIGRTPDGATTLDNAADFHALPTPSPGLSNVP
jgi:hypothetical protein